MRILGIEKLSLVDWPDKLCATIFTGGCDFCCPFCHNADIVFNSYDPLSETEVLGYLSKRRKVLDGEDIHENIIQMMNQDIDITVKTYCSDTVAENWNLDGLRSQYMNVYLMDTDLRYTIDELNEISQKDIIDFVQRRGELIYDMREEEFGKENMRELERVCLLKTVDRYWMDHIDAMDELKNGIGLRSLAQRNPVEEYRFEGFNMFDEMIAAIREDTVKLVLTMPVRVQAPQREQVLRPDTPGKNTPYRNLRRAEKKKRAKR